MTKVHLKDEADLMRLGRMVGPDGKTAVPIEVPTEAWPDDKLLAYAKAKLGEAQQVEEEAISLGRRSPERHFWAGKAYTLLHAKHKGHWKKFQRDHKLAVGTVWEAEQVYEKAVAVVPEEKEAAAAILSGRWGDIITAVKTALGVTKLVSKATAPPTHQTGEVKGEGDSTGDGRPILKFSQRGTSESTGQQENVSEPVEDEDMEESMVLSSATGRLRAIRTANHYLVLLNTNEGAVVADLLNRSLPIRLEATGDLLQRIARAKGILGGDIKHEWLPAHREQIEAEKWGMIERWLKEGKPLDKAVHHPMGPWAQTIGGILQVNGFKDFLRNYNGTRAAADPIRESIGILAFFAGNEPLRSLDLANLAIKQGLGKTLLPGVDTGNEAACQRAIGVTLSPYVGETFTARTAAERVAYRLKKTEGRFGSPTPHFRYSFEEVKREAVSENDLGGVVLEEVGQTPPQEAHGRHPNQINQPPDLNQYQPKTVDQLRQELLADKNVGDDTGKHVGNAAEDSQEGRRE